MGDGIVFGPYAVLADAGGARHWSLGQNVPNPFTLASGTEIHYSAAAQSEVRILIYDAAGRLVNTLVDQAKPGENFVLWDGKAADGRTVAGGVYFYQIKAERFTSQKKMLVLD